MRSRIADAEVARVGACAIGLAYAERCGSEAVRELIGMADGDRRVLDTARRRLRRLDTVDADVRRRAATVLRAAADALDDDPSVAVHRSADVAVPRS